MSLWIRLQGVAVQPTQEDKITWLHTVDGQYTARSAYKIQFLGMTSSMIAETTWKTKAPPKCRFFTWLMLQNCIWTAARLMLRQWPNGYFCQLCVRNLETTSHLFQECGYSRNVWDKVGSWIGAAAIRPTNWTPTQDLGQWYTDMGNSGTRLCKRRGAIDDHADNLGTVEGEEQPGFQQILQNAGAGLRSNPGGSKDMDMGWK